MSKSAEGNGETSRSHNRHSFPITPKKPRRNPPSMPKLSPPPPQHANHINIGDSTPVDNTPITNEQYAKLMAQYQTIAKSWAKHTKQMKKQQRQKGSRSNEITHSSSRENESQSSSTKRRNKKPKKQADSNEASAPYT